MINELFRDARMTKQIHSREAQVKGLAAEECAVMKKKIIGHSDRKRIFRCKSLALSHDLNQSALPS